ncbi:nucleoside kinase [Spirochaetia bacterium 38H-sp]|uniref:Nucleoside kinase n=1 Tax=Rarispira pelagica TaxID=3141764 RepID=A0ABU9UDX6_9SPIR
MTKVLISLPYKHEIKIDYGTRIKDIFEEYMPETKAIAARVNNELVSLSYKVEFNSIIEPISLEDKEGNIIYKATLCFILAMATQEDRIITELVIGHSLGDGYYYTKRDFSDISEQKIKQLEKKMREIISGNLEIKRTVLSYQDAIELFKKRGQYQTEKLLKFKNQNKIPVYKCNNYYDITTVALLPRTGYIQDFKLQKYNNGFILRFPQEPTKRIDSSLSPPEKLFEIYKQYKEWGKSIGVSSVGDLNTFVQERKEREFIQIAEYLQETKISQIATKLAEDSNNVKIVLIAGPSSSGKTTFSKKLSMYLRVMGLKPLAISLDDYFQPREKTPLDEDGNYDFESLYALDLEALNIDLLALMEGKAIPRRVFDFKKGEPRYLDKKLQIPSDGIIVVEGIHALNEELTAKIPHENKKKIYISALTQLNLDDHNRIPTTDNRLIRRMVRDSQFRAKTALDTLKMWPSVRRGEERNIFPFQEEADFIFNSALDYELSVLKVLAEPLLRSVKPYHREYLEATRLLGFLDNFLPISPQYVPGRSILREFIGDSEFHY